MKRSTRILFPIITIFLFYITVAYAENALEICRNCHGDIFNKALNYRFRHPVAINKCAECHSTDTPVSSSSAPVKKEIISKLTSSNYNREEVFQLKSLENNIEYEIEIVAKNRKGIKSEPKIVTIKPLDLDKKTVLPLTEINNVTVEEVNQGIFIDASLYWVTGTPATTEIEYGLTKDLRNHLTGSYNFTKEHRIKINGLIKGKQYYFKVISKDILGNIVESKQGTINTSQQIRKEIIVSALSGAPEIYYTEIFNVLNLGTFISVSLGQYSKTQLTISKKAEAKTEEQEEVSHSFPTERYSTITVCIKCHNQGASHPVGVRASTPGVITPIDLPTIENGIVTCVTCHEPHGSNKEYFSRFDTVRIICIKCHLDEYL